MPADQILLPRRSRAVLTRSRWTTRRVPVAGYAAALLLLPVLVLTGATAAGWWSTTGRSGITAAGGRGAGAAEAAGGGSGLPATSADVRGTTTVRQVADAFPAVTTGQILAAFGAAADTPADTPLKSLVQEGGGGLTLPAFRTWLAERVGG